ncbi:MAG: M10 family metallopeptidase C-terminal domain-containing protein [Pseudomonadota bacterium]
MDTLTGGAGAETIIGMDGADTLTGGAGGDTFRYTSNTNSTTASWDSITDFVIGTDRIEITGGLTGMTLVTNPGTTDPMPQTSANNFATSAADNTVLYWTQTNGGSGTTNGYIYVKSSTVPAMNGLFIELKGVTGTLTQADFLGVAFGIGGTPTTGNDVLTGTAAGEVIDALGGNDTINAGDGNDTLIGGMGQDTLTGGAGADLFTFAAGESPSATPDTITDFITAIDKISFSGMAGITYTGTPYTALGGTPQDTAAIITGDGAITDQVVFFTQNGDGWLFVKGAGTGVNFADTMIRLAGVTTAPAPGDLLGTGSLNTVTGTAGVDTLTGTAGADFFDALDGNDTINVGQGFDTVSGGLGTDTVVVADTVAVTDIGQNGNDLVLGYQGGTGGVTLKNLFTGDGAEQITMRFGDIAEPVKTYTILAGQTGDAANNIMAGTGGNDLISGGDGDDIFYGATGADTLDGGTGFDVISGNEGADTITGGAGGDWLSGGSEADVFRYTANSDSTTADWDGISDFVIGTDKIELGAGLTGMTLVTNPGATSPLPEDSAAVFAAAAADNTILFWNQQDGGSGPTNGYVYVKSSTVPAMNGLFIELNGVTGVLTQADFLGVAFAGGAGTIAGTGGVDTLTGTAGNDVFDAQAGDDTIHVGQGNDTVSGGSGIDTVIVDPTVTVSSVAVAGSDLVLGYQGGGSVTLLNQYGGTPDGAEKVSMVFGDGWVQTYSVTQTPDADSNIIANIGATDSVVAGTGDDLVLGGSGANILHGQAGMDGLWGQAGTDTLTGGLGEDWLEGGSEADTFRFLSAADSHLDEWDVLADFATGIDKLDFVGLEGAVLKVDTVDVTLSKSATAEQTAFNIASNGTIPAGSIVFWKQDTNGDASTDGYIYIKAPGTQWDGFFIEMRNYAGTLTSADILQLGAAPAAGTAISWDGGGGTSAWETAANWSTDSVPTAGSDVNIGGITVSHSTGVDAINSLNVAAAADLVLGGGSLAVTGDANVALGAALTLNGGTLSGGGSLNVLGDLQFNSGTLAMTDGAKVAGMLTLGAGSRILDTALAVNGYSSVTGGTTAGTGQLVNAGRMDVSGAATFGVGLVNDGVIEVMGTTLTANGELVTSGIVELDSVYNTAGAAGITLGQGSGLVIANGGELRATDGGAGATRTVTGRIDLIDGTIAVMGDMTFNIQNQMFWIEEGAFELATGKTLTVNAGTGGKTIIDALGPIEFWGDGTVNLTGTHTLWLDTDFNYMGYDSLKFGGSVTVGTDTGRTFYNNNQMTLTGNDDQFLAALRNTGTLTVKSDDVHGAAALTFQGGIVNTNRMVLEAGGSGHGVTLNMSGSTLTNNAGATLSTLLTGSGGTITVNGLLNNAGTLDVDHNLSLGTASGAHLNSGTIDLAAGTTLTVNVSNLDNSGTIQGSGTITTAGGAQLNNSGTLAAGGDGIGTLAISGILNLSGTSDVMVDITSAGTDLITAGNYIALGGMLDLNFGDLIPTNGQQFTVMTSPNFYYGLGADNTTGTADDLTHNLGDDWTATASVSGTNLIVTVAETANVKHFTGGGDWNGGTWTDAAPTVGQSAVIDSSVNLMGVTATLDVVKANAGMTVTGGSTLTVNNLMTVAAGQTLNMQGGILGGAGDIHADALTFGSGTLDGTGTMEVAGMATVTTGVVNRSLVLGGTTTLTDGSLTGTGTVTNRNTFVVSGASAASIQVAFVNALAATLMFDANSASAALSVDTGASFSNQGAVQLGNSTATTDTSMVAWTLNGGTGSFNNQGVLLVDHGNAAAGAHTITGTINNAFVIDIDHSLTVDGTLNNAMGASIDIATGKTLAMAAGDSLQNNGTISTGAGGVATIDVSAATFTSNGMLDPGGTGIGTLNVSGDLSMGGDAYTEIDISGTTSDIVAVSGNMLLDGTLVIDADGTITAGDVHTPLTWTTTTGTFDEILGLDSDPIGALVFDPLFIAGGLQLTARTVNLSGTAGNDTLAGSAAADYALGGTGDDTITGGGGADVLFGQAGNDTVSISDTGFHFLDGGCGVDTLRVEASLDLSALRADLIQDFEFIDLGAAGNQTLTLTGQIAAGMASYMNDATGLMNSLVIFGNSGDAVQLAGGNWTSNGTATVQEDPGASYTVYSNSTTGVQVFVDTNVSVTTP